jgi:integrase
MENSMTRFTDRYVAGLKAQPERYTRWEGGGFGIRVTPRAVKSWVLAYHFQGRSRFLTFGTYPQMGVADAHIALAAARKLLAQEVDPGAVKIAAHRDERDAVTVAVLVEEYLAKWARPRKRSAAEDERQLRKDVIPRWGRRKAKDITRRDVIALVDIIVARGSPISANRTLATLRKMFNWALSRDLVPASPCVAVSAPGKERRRDRVLSADEIARFWNALDDPVLPIFPPIRLALKFQLCTAQRKGEVIGAQWDELDLEENIWTIPTERSKNGLPHRVPLSPLARALLEEIARLSPCAAASGLSGSRWLFGSPRRQGERIATRSVSHAVRSNRARLGIGDVVPHDLRRSAASHMTSIGITRLVVSKILNHAELGVTSVYDRHSYDAEKRAALSGRPVGGDLRHPAGAPQCRRLRGGVGELR